MLAVGFLIILTGTTLELEEIQKIVSLLVWLFWFLGKCKNTINSEGNKSRAPSPLSYYSTGRIPSGRGD